MLHRALILAVFVWASCCAFCQTTLRVPAIISGQAAFRLSDLECSIAGTPVKITNLEPLRDQRLQYMLLNDSSGSGQRNWPNGTAQQAALEDLFLSSIVHRDADVGTLVNFSDQTYIDVIGERDPAAIAKKIDRTGRGGSATYDAIMKSAGWFAAQPALPASRKVLFMFTDGDEDNASRQDMRKAEESLRKGAIPLFVFMPASGASRKGARAYAEIADNSGGRAYMFPAKRPESDVFEALKADLANGYLLDLAIPADIPKGDKKLEISSKQNHDIQVAGPSTIYLPKK